MPNKPPAAAVQSSMHRGFAFLLASCVVVSGCASGTSRATDALSRLRPGMTRDEVRGSVGEPDRITGSVDAGLETWQYRFVDPDTNAGQVIVMVVVVVALVALVVVVICASRSGGNFGNLGGLGGGGGGGSSSKSHALFTVRFGRDGRVQGLSGIDVEK